jgi:hypothetical protein
MLITCHPLPDDCAYRYAFTTPDLPIHEALFERTTRNLIFLEKQFSGKLPRRCVLQPPYYSDENFSEYIAPLSDSINLKLTNFLTLIISEIDK